MTKVPDGWEVESTIPAGFEIESAPRPASRPKPKPAAKPQARSWLGEIGHQVGLTGRALVEGAADTASIVTNPLNSIVNAGLDAVGSDYRIGTDLGGQTTKALDQAGVSKPETATERAVNTAGRFMVGGGAVVRGGQALAKAATPVARAIGTQLAANAPAEIGYSGVSGLASGTTREAGGGPVAQTIAAVAAPVGLAVGAPRIANAARNAAEQVIAPEKAFARSQSGNSFVDYDAHVAQRLKDIAEDPARVGPKGKPAPVTDQDVAALRKSFVSDARRSVAAVEVPAAERAALDSALANSDSLTMTQVDALRGSVAGDAVADAVTLTKRLDALTPSVSKVKTTATGLVRDLAIDGIAHAALGPVGGIAGAAKAGISAYRTLAAPSNLSRSAAVAKLVKNAPRYDAVTSGRNIAESADNLANAAVAAREAQVAQNAQRNATRAQVASERADMRTFGSIRSKVPDLRDVAAIARAKSLKLSGQQANSFANESERGLKRFDSQMAGLDKADNSAAKVVAAEQAAVTQAQARIVSGAHLHELGRGRFDNAAVDTVVRTMADNPALSHIADKVAAGASLGRGEKAIIRAQMDKAAADGLITPIIKPKVPRPPRPASAVDALQQHNISTGAQSQYKYIDQIAGDAGTTAAEVRRGLDMLEAQVPSAKGMLDLMRSQQKLPRGAKAPVQAAIEQMVAQGKLAKAAKPKPVPKPKPAANDAAASPSPSVADDVVKVGDEVRWNAGKSKYQERANRAIDALDGDARIDPVIKDSIAGVGEQIRDDYKTVAEAIDYIDTDVMPKLAGEADAPLVREHLVTIARSKPFMTPEQLTAATRR